MCGATRDVRFGPIADMRPFESPRSYFRHKHLIAKPELNLAEGCQAIRL
jgi:hypothetical protein